MDGNKEKIIEELFIFAKEIMDTKSLYPYVAFVVKDGVIISRGYNSEKETKDVTRQGDVDAIRNAQEALDTGDLNGYSLYSFFEPTILGFDVALWSGIKDFHWCINSKSLPKHYHKMNYTPLDYAKKHSDISIENGIREQEALMYVEIATANKFYPNNLI